MAFHHRIQLPAFSGSYVCATNAPTVSRAVVFVHGFLGDAYETWLQFQPLLDSARAVPWWDESDLYFWSYDSFNTSVSKAADELLVLLDRIEPAPADWFVARPSAHPLFADFEDVQLRDSDTEYKELVLVAHSLGGLVVRYALLQRMLPLEYGGLAPSTLLRNATVRLFAPAINGSRPNGINAFILATSGPGALARASFDQSPSYKDMLPTGGLIGPTRRTTETLAVKHAGVRALRARVAWGESDAIVSDTQYDCDTSNSTRMAGKDHVSVCKPESLASAPVLMVRDGAF